jgi:hypothetical protein
MAMTGDGAPGRQVAIRMTPEHWLSADFGKDLR